MRVLQLIDSLDAGGAERMAVNIANVLSEEVERSYLCVTRREGLLKTSIEPSVSYLFLNKRHRIDISAIITLRRYLKREKIDIIHAHSTSFFMATIMKWLDSRLKIVWHDHYGNSNYLEARKYGILKFCSRYFSMIISVNLTLKGWATSHLKCKRVLCLPNFVIQKPTKLSVTKLKGTVGKRLLCVANLRPQKDHHNLLEAFKLLQEHYPEWTLHCVGQDFNDNHATSVYSLVEKLNLKNQVFFYGSCPDIHHIISQADIGVLASASEGLPLALLEYGLGKLPIVATNVGDCKDALPIICHPYLVEPNNPRLLAEKLGGLIADLKLSQHLGNLIYQHVLSGFSIKIFKKRLLQIYSKI